MTAPRLLMILTENEPLIDLGDLDAMVELARIADTEGFDAVMLSEHLALGPAAGALGRPTNPREYAAPGNQDPAMGWPSQIVMASAIAATAGPGASNASCSTTRTFSLSVFAARSCCPSNWEYGKLCNGKCR